MDLDVFWDLIDRSAAITSDQHERTQWLTSRLAGLGRSVIGEVAACPDAPAVRTLLAVGAETWPDSTWPFWPGRAWVAHDAFFTATGRSLHDALRGLGCLRVGDAGPLTGAVWDLDSPVEAAQRLPRLRQLAIGLEEGGLTRHDRSAPKIVRPPR
ncbi:hypothetical protein [Lentzea nigeriaca]|uniref:hypothetical protein n=1 Tax=Lentzea nigeriaca TaxID=1128665 RepID=UPI00195E1C49|nr:hypothetical protein [Lentzea nigeriaca]MBM7862512.1 hypothetical protein [Lentzea nigeriaca]